MHVRVLNALYCFALTNSIDHGITPVLTPISLNESSVLYPASGSSMKEGPTPAGGVEYRVAQSGDATCNGLFSATEGSRTMALKRGLLLNSYSLQIRAFFEVAWGNVASPQFVFEVSLLGLQLLDLIIC